MPRRKPAKLPVREGALEAKHCRILEDLGWKCWKQSGLGRAGRPDRHLMGPLGISLHIEWKRPGEVPTTLQAGELDELGAMGHHVAACDSIESADKFVTSAKCDGPWAMMHWRQRWRHEHPRGAGLPPEVKRG